MFLSRGCSFHKSLIVLLGLVLGVFPLAANAAPTAEGLLAQGRIDEAISSLQEKLSSAPNDAESYNLLCRAYFVLENWDGGIKACQKAVSLQPSNSQYHLWLGRIYGEKASHSSFFSAAGLAKKVRTEFETAVQLDPANLEARSDLAEFYVEAPGMVGGGKDKAAAQAQELSKLDPAQGDLVQAWIAEKNKDLTTAEKDFRAAVDVSHGRAGSWLALAQFYRRTGHPDKMQAALEQAVSANNKNQVLMKAAEILVGSKQNLPQAAELLHQYLDSKTVEDAPAFKAHYLLGMIDEQQGDSVAAAEEYRSALALAKGFTLAQSALERVTHQMASNTGPR